MRQRDLREPRRPGDLPDAQLVLGEAVAVHADHGHRAEPCRVRVAQRALHRRRIERCHHRAVRGDPLVGLDDLRVEQFREQDPAVEDPRPVLIGDAERVPEAPRDHEDGRVALPLEQRVGGDGGAEPHRLDGPGGNLFVRADAEQVPDAGDRCVSVALRVLRQQLVGKQRPVGLPGDNIGKGAAPVHPELPAPVHDVYSYPSLPGGAGSRAAARRTGACRRARAPLTRTMPASRRTAVENEVSVPAQRGLTALGHAS